ncbi:MAG TPA: hypothetical protein VE911_05850, partial [Candidatus Nitrosopolaris sp.]|nr:hypothetical protein [Candidatus Nitrosopolaris sp.]
PATGTAYSKPQVVPRDSKPAAPVERLHVGIEIIGGILEVKVIAIGRRIRDRRRIVRLYGRGRWRKMKGIARVSIDGGPPLVGEVHWYEATGVGRRELKLKRILRG